MLYAQIEGAKVAIDTAAKAGWEPVVLVLILISFLGGFGIMAKWFVASYERQQTANGEAMKSQLDVAAKREERLANRITELENFIRSTMLGMIKDTHEALVSCRDAINRFSEKMDDKPCLMSEERREVVMDAITKAIEHNS